MINTNLSQIYGESIKISLDNLKIDLTMRKVEIDHKLISLSPREYDLLICFALNQNKIMTNNDLLIWVWQCSTLTGGTVNQIRSCLKRLRRKLGQWGKDRLLSKRGTGYWLDING